LAGLLLISGSTASSFAKMGTGQSGGDRSEQPLINTPIYFTLVTIALQRQKPTRQKPIRLAFTASPASPEPCPANDPSPSVATLPRPCASALLLLLSGPGNQAPRLWLWTAPDLFQFLQVLLQVHFFEHGPGFFQALPGDDAVKLVLFLFI